MWVGNNYAGLTVTLWIDPTSIRIILGAEVIKTVPSRITTADLEHLSLRGVRAGRAGPAIPAVADQAVGERSAPVEIDRTANCDGVDVVRGHDLSLGAAITGTRITLRFDRGLIHATAGNMLLNPFSHNELQQLRATGSAASSIPPQPPAGPQSMQRRVPKDGVIMVAGQRVRVGQTQTPGPSSPSSLKIISFASSTASKSCHCTPGHQPSPSATSTLTAPANGNHVPITTGRVCPGTSQVSVPRSTRPA